ncbi:MAG: zinc ribbon domain-containing protein [Gemmatimonadaceae bacterium]|nr:zinc ribbon domain-containing protein [Gemmatimonadaceae bacterium]
MTSLVIGIVLLVGGIAFAAYPFLRPSTKEEDPGVPDTGAGRARPAPVAASLDPVAAELEELELDRAMGKLSDSDYQRIRAALESRLRGTPAASAPRRATPPAPGAVQATSPAAPTAVPPVSVAAAVPADLADEAERLIAAERAQVVQCGTCGPRPEPAARFCSTCGRAIGGCPSCGKAIRQSGARFCDQCGTALVR